MSGILEVLRAAPFKPLVRPLLPSFDNLQPTMRRAAWLDRARNEHHVFGLAQKLLDLCDLELASIAREHRDGLAEMDAKLQDIQAHYANGLEVAAATRAWIAAALVGVSA